MGKILGAIMWLLVAITYMWKYIVTLLIVFCVLVVIGAIQEARKNKS